MLVIKNKDKEEVKAPHLALTHEAQGGPANLRPAALLMKSVDDLTAEDKVVLDTFLKSQDPKDQIEKSSYQSLYRKLDAATTAYAKEKIDRWGWAYVRDFSDTHVVFSSDGGVIAVSYSVDASGNVELGDDAIPVNEMISWENAEGKVVVTQSDSIPSDVSQLVIKSFSEPKADDEKLTNLFKSKYEGEQMNELEAQNKTLTDELASVKADLEKALATIKADQEAKALEKAAKRLEIVKSVASADKVEVLAKSLELLEDDAFNTVIESLKVAQAATNEDKNELFKTVSKGDAPTTDAVAKSDMESLRDLMKSRNTSN